MAITSQGTATYSGPDLETTNTRAMSIATMLFFMWGFLTCLNDILIPHLKSIFDLNYFEAMMVQFAFFSSYFVFALPAGKLVDRIGYKRSMVTGLVIMAMGALLFLPAASFATFPLFLGALVVLAGGITLLQVAANPYVANLGPQRTASSRLNLSQAFNSLGTTVAPYFGAAVILSAVTLSPERLRALSGAALQTYREQQASTVRLPYAGIALALILLAISLAVIKLPSMSFTQEIRPGELDTTVTNDSVWRHRQLLLGALGIFLYVGAEVSIGSFLVNYFSVPEIGNMTERDAAHLVTYYWGGAMVGRFVGSWLLTKFRTSQLLGITAIIAAVLVAISMLTFGHTAVWSILAVGLFNSIMFPSIFTLGIEGLGPLTSRGSSLMVAAIVGGALLPVLQGAIADRIGVHHAFFIPVLCYLYIAGFGLTRGRSAYVPKVPAAVPVA